MKILLISHGMMASGTKETLSLFTNTDSITAISAYTEKCEHPDEALKQFFDEAGSERVVAFSDILCGSVNQYLFAYKERPNTYIFCGMNLPMLLQATMLNDESTPEEIEAVAEEGKNGIISMQTYQMPTMDDGDE